MICVVWRHTFNVTAINFLFCVISFEPQQSSRTKTTLYYKIHSDILNPSLYGSFHTSTIEYQSLIATSKIRPLQIYGRPLRSKSYNITIFLIYYYIRRGGLLGSSNVCMTLTYSRYCLHPHQYIRTSNILLVLCLLFLSLGFPSLIHRASWPAANYLLQIFLLIPLCVFIHYYHSSYLNSWIWVLDQV